MFITYRRVGVSAVFPALAAAGVFIIVGGVAATIAMTTLVVGGGVVLGVRLLRASGLGGAIGGTRRRVAFPADNTIEGIVGHRSPDRQPTVTQPQGPAPTGAAGPR